MVETLWDGESHSVLEDASGLPWEALGGLTEEFKAGVGEQGTLAASRFEGVVDELGESLAFPDGIEVDASAEAAGEGGVVSPFEGLGENWVSDEPDGDEVTGVEGEVEEGREVAEEVVGEVLSFVDEPDGEQVFSFGEGQDAILEGTPEGGAAMGRIETEGEGQALVEVESAEVGFGEVDDLVAVRVEGQDEASQGGGFADAGFAGEQPDAGLVEEPLKALVEDLQGWILPKIGSALAEWEMFEAEVLQDHQMSPLGL